MISINKKGSTSIRTVFPLLLLVAAMVCVSATIFVNTSEDVEGVQIGDLGYTLDDDGTATVAAFNNVLGKITISATLTHDGKTYNVTSIGNNAFFNSSGLEEITIPAGVTSIGTSAFYGCSQLTSISIPDSVTKIGSSAFSRCSQLTEITFGDDSALESIGSSAFEDCSQLTEITIPNSVTSIGDNAFSRCSQLTEITIPSGVTSMHGYVFWGCSGLSTVTISGKGVGNGDILGTYFNGTDWKIQGSAPITTLVIDTTDEININSVNIIEDKILKITPKSEKVTGATDKVIFDGSEVTGEDRAGKEYIGTGEKWIGGKVTVTVTISPNGGGSVDGTTEYIAGETASLTAVPEEGYEFVEWIDNTTTHEDDPYSFRIKKDVELTAVFKKISVTLTVSADPTEGGTVEKNKDELFHNDEVTVTATPNEGYSFVEWRDGEKWLSADLSYSFTIEEDTTLTAVFEIIMVDLSVRADPSHQGDVKGSGTYEYGTIVKITATPNDGYKFVAWSDGNENAERSLKLTADTSLTAYFVEDDPDLCTITVIIKGNGNVYGMGTFAKGTVITLNASPDQGYSFQGWSHTPYAGQTVQLSVESDMVITATFSQNDTGIGGSNTTIDTTTVIIIVVVIVVIFGIIVAVSLIRGRGSV